MIGTQENIIRIGGVPEHFNIPVMMAQEKEACGELVKLKFEKVLGGTGAMIKKIKDEDLNIVIALTECLIAEIEKGEDLVLLSKYVTSPLTWGISVAAGSNITCIDDLEGKVFGISRYGSGSHLMADVLARNHGWTKPPQFKVCNNFATLRAEINVGNIDVFLWEHFTTKPFQDKGEVKIIGGIPTPWAPFSMACKRSYAEKNADLLNVILKTLSRMCVEFKTKSAVSLDLISKEFLLTQEDAQAWFKQVFYASYPEGVVWSKHELLNIREILVDSKILPPSNMDVINYIEPNIATLID